MLSGRQKILGGLLVGVTAVLVGYAMTRAFSGAPVNAVNAGAEPGLEATPDISLSAPEAGSSVDGGLLSTDGAAPAMTVGAPVATAPAPAAERPRNRVYTVQNNDSFWKIAQKVYGDAKYVNKLAAANASHKSLRSGMRVICPSFDGAEFQLQLPLVDEAGNDTPAATTADPLASIAPDMPGIAPAPAQTVAAPAPAAASPDTADAAPASGRTHVVTSGENLYDIAKKYYNNGSAWPKIAAANPKINANAIRPGQTLVIP